MKVNPKLYHISLIFYCLVIFILSSLPGDAFPKVGFDYGDKVLHGLVYAILFLLFFYSLKNQTKSVKLQKFSLEYSLLFTSLYGITDEIHQYFVPFRSCEFADWVADTFGALLVYFILKMFLKKKRLAVTILMFSILGCSGTERSGMESVKIILDTTEAWVDFMPTVGNPPENRFGFVVKVNFAGAVDTNYIVKNLKVAINDKEPVVKRFESKFDKINDSTNVLSVFQNRNENYLNVDKDFPGTASFSFDIYKSDKLVKTIKTPTIAMGRVE